jgi:nucleotide-binding universal stress UspA family protein
MYTKIVVPLDGSPLSEVALPYAEEIAGRLGCNLVLFTVLPADDPEEIQNHASYISRMIDITRRQVEKYTKNLSEKNISVDAATYIGNPAEGILNYAEKSYPSLIVMATHGRSGVGRWAVGSVADKVVRATTRQPLLLIRAKGAHPDVRAKRTLKKAVVPLDGSPLSEAVIPYIKEIANLLKMEVTLIQVIQKTNGYRADAEAYLKEWCERFTEQGITSKYEVRSGSAAEQIIDLIDNAASDLVAMSTRGQTAINLWSLGSVAQKVLLGGTSPLLLVRS